MKELKSIFFKKKNHCKLDYYFLYWDMKLKKYKKIYDRIQFDVKERKRTKKHKISKTPTIVHELVEEEDDELAWTAAI